MATVAWSAPGVGRWRTSRRDAVLVALAALHAIVLTTWPATPVIAVGLWWNANTIAHNFIHRPFFQSLWMNRGFSLALSILQGIPQTLWRDRHLAHHADRRWRLQISPQLAFETVVVLCLWATLAYLHPRFFLLTYLPGYLVGLAACAAQGYWEHPSGQPVSHYGRIYNFLCFNDGYHAEHHAYPGMHWSRLPGQVQPGAAPSCWPPLLRWMELHPLEVLERIVLRSQSLQDFVLRSHRRAFAALLPRSAPVRRAVIVGGGLFPRTALILRQILPEAQLIIIDADPHNLAIARAIFGDNAEYRHERYIPGEVRACDLVVIPLCLEGPRASIYRHPPAATVLVHDWIWRRRGIGVVVSPILFKRLNLVQR